jgi:hypothetical protein
VGLELIRPVVAVEGVVHKRISCQQKGGEGWTQDHGGWAGIHKYDQYITEPQLARGDAKEVSLQVQSK